MTAEMLRGKGKGDMQSGSLDVDMHRWPRVEGLARSHEERKTSRIKHVYITSWHVIVDQPRSNVLQMDFSCQGSTFRRIAFPSRFNRITMLHMQMTIEIS